MIESTYYRLRSADIDEFESTDSFFDALESAFIWAYLGTVEETGIPDHVEAAINDARAFTRTEFDGQPDADLRTDVVPTLYTRGQIPLQVPGCQRRHEQWGRQ